MSGIGRFAQAAHGIVAEVAVPLVAVLARGQVAQFVILVVTLNLMTARQGDQLLGQLVLTGVIEGSFDRAELFFNRQPQLVAGDGQFAAVDTDGGVAPQLIIAVADGIAQGGLTADALPHDIVLMADAVTTDRLFNQAAFGVIAALDLAVGIACDRSGCQEHHSGSVR